MLFDDWAIVSQGHQACFVLRRGVWSPPDVINATSAEHAQVRDVLALVDGQFERSAANVSTAL